MNNENPDNPIKKTPSKNIRDIFPNVLKVLNVLSSSNETISSFSSDENIEAGDFISDSSNKNQENTQPINETQSKEINENEENIHNDNNQPELGDIQLDDDTKNISEETQNEIQDKNDSNDINNPILSNDENNDSKDSQQDINNPILSNDENNDNENQINNIEKVEKDPNSPDQNDQSNPNQEESISTIPNFVSVNMDEEISVDSNINEKQLNEIEIDNTNQISLVDAATETEPVSPRSPDIFGKLLETHTIPLIERPTKQKTFETGLDTPAQEQSMTSQNSSLQMSSRYRSQNSSPIRSRPSTSSTPKRSRKTINAKATPPTEAELQEALDLLLNQHILPKPSIRSYVIGYAKKIESRKMLAQDYDDVTDIDVAIDVMYTSIESDKIQEDHMIQDSILQDRFETAKLQKQETQDKYTDLIQNEINRYQAKEKELLEKHKVEVENLKKDWKNPNKIASFNKPSSKLFQLRKQQKLMALIHDFQSAKQLKNEAEQLEKKEAQIAIKKAQDTMKIEYRQLLDRQQKELFCLRENHEKHLASLKSNQEKDIESASMRVQLLQTQLDSKRTLRNKGKLPMLKQRSPMNTAPPSGMITQRTRSQLSKYRKECDTLRLPLRFDFVDSTIVTPR